MEQTDGFYRKGAEDLDQNTFRRCMKQGLGRCILALEQAEDVEPYREAVLWGCLHDLSYDTQCEGTRAVYVYTLTTYFENADEFVEPTVEAFLKLSYRRDWTFSHFCELLRLFAQNGSDRAREALNQKYYTLLERLLGKRRFGSYDFERDNFECVCISLTSLDGMEALGKIAEDMGHLFAVNPHYDGWHFDWFYANAEDKLGERQTERFLIRLSKRSENVRLFCEKMEQAKQSLKQTVRDPVPTLTAENAVTEVADTGKLSPASRIRFAKGTEADEKTRLARSVIAEEDPDKKAELLSVFAFRDEAFSLEHETVIGYAESAHENLRDTALEVLTNCKSEAVRNYALRLLESERHLSYAVQMLIENYRPCDRERLLSVLRNIRVDYKDTSDWHSIGSKILDAYSKKIRLPKEFLLWIYENTLCSYCRESAVRKLSRHKWLTPELIEECRYDSNGDIRRYIERYHPLPR